MTVKKIKDIFKGLSSKTEIDIMLQQADVYGEPGEYYWVNMQKVKLVKETDESGNYYWALYIYREF